MQNRIVLHERFIEIICVGDQTAESVEWISAEARRITQEVWGEKPPLVLVDLCEMGESSFDSRKAAVKSLRGIPFGRIAICANSIFLRRVAELIVRASGFRKKIRVLTTRQEALDWLLSKQQH